MESLIKVASIVAFLFFSNESLSQAQPCPTTAAYGENSDAGRRAMVNGISLYYETYGTGSPLLVIHGNGGSIRSMRCQIAHFSRSHRVIAADSRAHGKSEDGTARLTYELMAEDLAKLLMHENIDATDIIGHSDGGIIALLLAINHPTRVKSLVVSGPNLRSDKSAMFAWNFDMYARDVKEAKAMLAKGDRSKNWERVKRWNELMIEEPNIHARELRRIKSPTLILGSDDDAVRPEHFLEIYRNISQPHLGIIPGATHFIHREEYELYNLLADRFLSKPFSRPTSKQVLENR